MLINRRTSLVKPGRVAEAIALLKSGASHLDWVPPFRVLQSSIGTVNQVVLELEFETLADYDKFWTSYRAAPESADVMAMWNELNLSGGTNEIWEVV